MMRILFLLSLALASCTAPAPTPTSAPTASARKEPSLEAPPETTPEKPAPVHPSPQSPIKPPSFVRTKLDGISIEAVAFDARSYLLAVADQPEGPDSRWPDCRAAGRASGGIAAINAGFFTPEGDPLGRVIADGVSAGGVNRASSLGAGFYVRSSAGTMELIRRDRFTGGHQALQSGPFLVENRRAVGGLSDKQSSARSFVAYDGGSQWLIARTGACSLKSLARALADQSIGSTRLTHVLNLDGGRSSEFWVSDHISNGPHFERPFWNKPVRNYLIVQPIR